MAEDSRHSYSTIYCAHCGRPHRVQLNCGDRTCPDCRKKWFGYHFQTLLDCVSNWKAVYFLTLTIRNIEDAQWGRFQVDKLRKDFSLFRRRFRSIDGGFYVVQATNRGKGWHLHLHILFDGHYLPKDAISKAWQEITGSFVVQIETVNNPKKAVRYLLSDFLQSPRIRPEDRADYNGVFKGLRLVQPFGKYRKLKLRVPYKCPECGCDLWFSELQINDLFPKRRRHYFGDP